MAVREIIVDEDFVKSQEKHRLPDKSKGFLESCSESLVLFSEKMLGLRLYSWQVYWLLRIEKSMHDPLLQREFVAITSRQIGKSTAIAVFSLWCAVFNKYPGTVSNNTVVGIVSASDVQAKKLLYEMKKLMRLGDTYVKNQYTNSSGEPLFGKQFFTDLLDENEPNNTTTVTFKHYESDVHGDYVLKDSRSGSVIKSYPPTSAVLGETFTIVVIDEAGKTDKISDQFFYDFMYPTGNSTNAIRIYTSTPWVSSGFFYRMVDPDDQYSQTEVDVVCFTIDAIKLENINYYNVVMKTVAQLNADGKNDEVQRAYFCRFVKGEQSYFDPNKVLDAFTDDYTQTYSYKGKCDMGVDFGGQVSSKTVITITELMDNGQVRRLYHKTYGVGEDDDLIEDIEILKHDFNIQRIIPDDCPAGQYMIRIMIDKGWDVQPMNFRSDKVKKYGAFRSFLNKGKILSYQDEDLKTEMLALENTPRARQSVIQHAPGYSDDLIDSFVLSCFFFVEEDDKVETFEWGSDQHNLTVMDKIRASREPKYEGVSNVFD